MGDEPDLAADELGILCAVVARHGHGAARRAHEGRQDLEQGRLAGAVGPQHRHRLAGTDVEIEAVQHAMVAEGLAETGHSDEWLGGHVMKPPNSRLAAGTGQGSGNLTRSANLLPNRSGRADRATAGGSGCSNSCWPGCCGWCRHCWRWRS